MAPRQLGLLPIVNWHLTGSGRQVVPEIFHELKFFGGTQIENRVDFRTHLRSPSMSDYISRHFFLKTHSTNRQSNMKPKSTGALKIGLLSSSTRAMRLILKAPGIWSISSRLKTAPPVEPGRSAAAVRPCNAARFKVGW